MGGRKARLLIDGLTLVDRHVRRLQAICSEVLVVGHAADVGLVPSMVVSDAPDMAGSLRIGLDRLPKRETIVVITPVDALPAEESTLRRLTKALEDPLVVAATPTFGGRGGHPVVIRRSALDALREGGTLHELLTSLGERRLRIEVDDPSTTTDLDEPAQVMALTGKPPTFLR